MAKDERDWKIADAPGAGMSKEIMRKAREINPELAAQGSTTDLLSKMQSTKPPQKAQATAIDLDEVVLKAKATLNANRRRIEEEMQRLQKDHAAEAQLALDTIIDAIIAVDPNLASPQTQEILKSEAPFFTEVGFTVRKVMDRKRAKRR